MSAPILEFDPERISIIEASAYYPPMDVPHAAVLCFFKEVIDRREAAGTLRKIRSFPSEIGRHRLWELEHAGRRVALAHPGVGAPLAAGVLEGMISTGCRRFVLCGGAGVLDSAMAVGRPIVPTSAIRDEGTSYHYLPASREVEPSASVTAVIRNVLERQGIPFATGKTWTTDAFFRETRDKVRKRREEGAITVEMEAAALFAVARFRGVEIGALLYAGDDVGGDAHDHRDWNKRADDRERLFTLACDVAAEL